MDQIELPDLIGEETVDGRRVYRWSDGSLTPVIRGGAGDDEDPDDDEEDEVDDDAEDEESEGEDDDGDEDEDEVDEEDEDDDDPEVDAAIDEIVAKVVDKLGDKFDSIADRRINKLVKRLDRKADRGGDDDEPKGRRSRRSQRDDEPEFSVRDARLAGMEIIRDEMPRLSTEDREIARDLLAAEIEKHRGDGDEDEVGEAAGKAVATRMKGLKTRTSKSTKAALRKTGALRTPKKQAAGSGKDRKSSKSRMAAGAARAARVRPQTTTEKKE